MLPDFIEQLEMLIDTRINGIHTAIPAEIVSFDGKTGTASVLPKAKINLSNGKSMDFPKINDVPVMFPRGSGSDAVIVYPIKVGDGCLLIISEQALDFWRSKGVTNSELKFSLANAIAIPGLFARPVADIEEAADSDSLIVRNGNTKLTLSRDNMTIRGNLYVEGNIFSTQNINATQGILGASGEFSEDVTAAGKSVAHHTHEDSSGEITSEPQ